MMIDKQKEILDFLKAHPRSSSKTLFDGLASQRSYASVKRILTKLLEENLVIVEGGGKASKYSCAAHLHLYYPIDVKRYFEKEIDERVIQTSFNLDLIHGMLREIPLFKAAELDKLAQLQSLFQANIAQLSPKEYEKALERLAIDLSWKSSQIEGNTYSLLETERLLKEKETATGKTKDEAVMLLNHKEAIEFLVEQKDYLTPLTVMKIEDIHSILMKELGVERNIRIRKVGITGTNYTPLDNEFQIKEALEQMCTLINHKTSIFEKALLALLLLSYIQPFVDGNKRTARIISNGILIENAHCPISFRTVDSIDYKKAMLIFYEQNNFQPMKDIFIGQFEFAVKTYF
jgi:prophage maintenance system killer protein